MNKKIITQQQIDQIVQVLFELNIGVKTFSGLKEMLDKLPVVLEEKGVKEEKTK